MKKSEGIKTIPNVNLELVPTDNLIEAVRKRFPECFILWAEWSDGTDGPQKRLNVEGAPSRLLGAAERVYRRFLRETDKATEG